MGEHFKACGAVMLFLCRKESGREQILLQKRCNTGYGDGMWDCGTSGHVEDGESMKAAMVREAKEELGIVIQYEDVHFATFTHKNTPGGAIYYNTFFYVNRYKGEPRIMEPEKCSDLQWFYLEELPENLLEDRKKALSNYKNRVPYSELGW